MMTSRFNIVVLFFLSFVFSSGASPVKFYSVNSLFGISMRETNSVCSDEQGFMWTSSKTGILRITEDDYRIYHLPYETADVIKVKLQYKNLSLLAYTNNGQIFEYDHVSDHFQLAVNLRKHIVNDDLIVFDLLIDDANIWWISTSSGIYKYEKGNLQPAFEFSSNRYGITWFDRTHIIVAKLDGIWMFNIQSLEKKQIYVAKPHESFHFFSLCLEADKTHLWMGTLSEGLFQYDFGRKTISPILKAVLPDQPILDIVENSDSTCLIGFDGQGIWELRKRIPKVLNIYTESLDVPYSLKGNGVYDMFCDPNRRVWVCTYSGGLSFFDQSSPLVTQITHSPNNSNSLVNNDVNDVLEDKEGKMWFATNNGISYWNPATNEWRNLYSDKEKQARVFLSLCEDNRGRIWAANYSSGVYVLDRKTGRELAHYQKGIGSPLLNNFILNIYKDSAGDIWLGGGNGTVVCFSEKENKFKTYSEEPIGCFIGLVNNQMFLGCSYGLSVLNKQTGIVKRLIQGLLVRDAVMVEKDIWICTSGEGLIRYNYESGDTERFTIQDGLPSNFLNSMIVRGDYFWIGTESGLCRFDPHTKAVSTYSSIYTLSRVSFNARARTSLLNGQLAWGTNNGVVIFSPDLVSESPASGKIYFQDLTVSGRSLRDIPSFDLKTPVDSLKSINLKYFQNTISLELVPIGISSDARFSWMLDGFDKEWTSPASNRIVTYTNLPSGTYLLKVKLYESSLSSVINERSIRIKIIPPFWRTIWFIVIVFVVVSGILILYFLFYVNRLKQRHTEEKVRFFTNTAHDIRTSLTLIKAPIEELGHERELSSSGKTYLNLAREQAQRLSFVVTQLMDFQKADVGKEQLNLVMVDLVQFISVRKIMYESFAQNRGVKLIFNCEKSNCVTAIDEIKMEKVVDNLLSNAVKYSHPGGQVLIDFNCTDKKWMLQVKDWGIGIGRKAQRQLFKEFYRSDNAINSKVVGSGIGLLLVRKYVSMHGGEVDCESQENVGSTFRIEVPVREVAGPVSPSGLSAKVNVQEAPPEATVAIDGGEIALSRELKVLVVEDNDDLLGFMSSALSNEFKVLKAEDGVRAWEVISRQLPDLVVSDIMMPNMNGYDLCKLIKSTYETSHIPIVLLTALSEKEEQLFGLGLGADDYLTKPFDMNLLIQRIKSIIRNREAVREKALKLIKGGSSEPIFTNDLNDKFLKRILEVARDNISNVQFSKELFASEMNMSPSLLYKKVKSLTDQTPTDFIKIVRLDKALELLMEKKYTVTEVSELCGFASVAYFSTVFKKHFGKSPTEVVE